MTLTSVVDLTGLNEGEEAVITLVLLISYLVTPLMSFSISAALSSIVSTGAECKSDSADRYTVSDTRTICTTEHCQTRNCARLQDRNIRRWCSIFCKHEPFVFAQHL